MNASTFARGLTAPLELGTLTLLGCGQDSATASLRALEPVGEMSVVCLGRDDTGAFTRGLDRSECPDFEYSLDSPNSRRLHALVTQPASGEVALVDLAANATEAVIDFEPSQPGYSFMPVGAEPASIVSTRGGVASFVGVREPGREGIFGLPSSCIAPRPPTAPLRDIRTWPACRLPVAPGPMILLQDPPLDDDGDLSTPPRVRQSCDAQYVEAAELVGQAPAASRESCPADLAGASEPLGRSKIAVALPSLGELWVLDAQELLDREPGSFDACSFEQRFVLSADTTDAAQRLPPDLVPSSASCSPVGFGHGPVPDAYKPWPVDVALDDEQRLYIADSEAPVVHVLDVSDPCAVAALPPLEPRSYTDPSAVVTTRRVAVSPLTPLLKRFVYAVDNSTTSTAGSLMVFDVSPGSTERTPVVRERSPFNPNEPPDRISLSRDVADVEFVFQDFAEPAGGLAIEGIACDPDPSIPADSAAAEYRTSLDLASGASPRKLRGVFAFAALHSGQIAVVDVEDLDAACRRPVSVNPGPVEDIYGCSGDDPRLLPGGYVSQAGQTVSGEESCNVVAPHRARGRAFFTNSAGAARSAGLLSFPTLTLETGRSVLTDLTEEGREHPKMLAARHAPGEPALLYIGPLEYNTDAPSNRLDVDPATADRSSLVLSYQEPRAYFPAEDFTGTYEGVVRQVGQALFSVDPATGLGVVKEGLNASFCSSGVQDVDVTRGIASDLGVTSSGDQAPFSRRHADYVQIVSDLLEEDDAYWTDPDAGASCGAALFPDENDSPTRLTGRSLCEQFFGPPEVPQDLRDWRIVAASEDRLLVEPRTFDPTLNSDTRRTRLAEFAACCFPGSTAFQVRAGHQWVVRGSATGLPHRITTDPNSLRCVEDCSPLVQRQRGRVFELSCSQNCPLDERGLPAVGYAVPGEDFACVVEDTANGIDPGEPGAECIFQSLTTRFAMYRGQKASRRDMRFRWQFSDGFTPLTIPLTSVERSRSTPHSLLLLPEVDLLLVSDGSARGITFVSPRSPVAASTTSIF